MWPLAEGKARARVLRPSKLRSRRQKDGRRATGVRIYLSPIKSLGSWRNTQKGKTAKRQSPSPRTASLHDAYVFSLCVYARCSYLIPVPIICEPRHGLVGQGRGARRWRVTLPSMLFRGRRNFPNFLFRRDSSGGGMHGRPSTKPIAW